MAEWISVKERLPEEGEKVLWFDRDDMEVGSVFRSRGVTFVSTSLDLFDIAEYTHWMPLPEPPKEE